MKWLIQILLLFGSLYLQASPCAEVLVKGSKEKNRIQLLVRAWYSEIHQLNNQELAQLMNDWIGSKIVVYGYLPGLRGDPGEPTDYASLEKSLKNDPSIWIAVYANAATPLSYALLRYQKPKLPKNIHVERLIPEAILVHEFSGRNLTLISDSSNGIRAYNVFNRYLLEILNM